MWISGREDLLIYIVLALEGFDVVNQPQQNIVNNYFRCVNWWFGNYGFGRNYDTSYNPFEKNTRLRHVNIWGYPHNHDYNENSDYWNEDNSYYYPGIPTWLVPDYLYKESTLKLRYQNTKQKLMYS